MLPLVVCRHGAVGEAAEAFRALGDPPRERGPRTVVLDEFPNLLNHSPELPSQLQRFIDNTKDGPNSPIESKSL